jgi:hypothetical protein
VTKKKSTRGGRREGAGRPSKPDAAKRKSKVMRVPEEIVPEVEKLIASVKPADQ